LRAEDIWFTSKEKKTRSAIINVVLTNEGKTATMLGA